MSEGFTIVEGDVVIRDEAGNPVAVVLDGSIYRLRTEAKIANAAGTIINPATQETLATVDSVLDSIKDTDGIKKITDALPVGDNRIGRVKVNNALDTTINPATQETLASLEGKDFATETTLATRASEATLATADGRLATIDAVLDSIKDVDGIKKITDPLPAGTNEIGKVAQGTKAAGADAWPIVLYDSAGNETGVLGNRLAVDTGAPIVGIISDKVKTAGGVTNMNVDGSVTPVVFTFDADPTNDILLQRMTIVFVPNVLRVDGVSFGPFGALTNGVRVTVTTNGTEIELGVLKLTEDLLSLSGATPLTDTGLAANDLLVVSFPFGDIPLIGGSGDNVKFEVRDDLTDAGPNSIKSFSAKVVGLET